MSIVRVVIENPSPCVDGGRFPAKRIVGDKIAIEADVFTDGHDAVACELLYRPERSADWQRVPMTPLGNDRWRGIFVAQLIGRYVFTVRGWVDHIETWQR